uniref:Retrotransposon protein, putative, unclassified n=1 Tax=Oryza sativa subsp. japonica TaxID=39947 RepID=Q2QR66_ORYSJ|nr:retrotransposon protein, putative, unclassified [Oryza sativa Japonica Group]
MAFRWVLEPREWWPRCCSTPKPGCLSGAARDGPRRRQSVAGGGRNGGSSGLRREWCFGGGLEEWAGGRDAARSGGAVGGSRTTGRGVEAGARHGEAKPTAYTARRGGGWGGGKKWPVNSGERRLLGLARGERARAPGARESWGNGRGDHGDRFYWLGAVGSWPRRAESTGNGLRSGLRRRGRSGVVRRRFWRGKVGEESGGGGATRSRGRGERAGGGGGGIGGDVGRPWRRFRLRESEVRDGPDSRYHEKRIRARTLSIGDYVLRRVQSQAGRNNLLPKWEGPYTITQVLRPGAFKIADGDGRELANSWNIDQLRKFYV